MFIIIFTRRKDMRKITKLLSMVVVFTFVAMSLNVSFAMAQTKGKATTKKTTKKAAIKPAAKPSGKELAKKAAEMAAKVSSSPKVTTVSRADEEKAVKAVVELNTKAAMDGDIKAYMSTIIQEEPLYSQTEQMMKSVFAAYKLDFKITEYSVVNITGNVAVVKITQETRKISGPDFVNSRVTAQHTLKKVNGQWKFYRTALIKAEELKDTTTPGGVEVTTPGGVQTTTDSGINKK